MSKGVLTHLMTLWTIVSWPIIVALPAGTLIYLGLLAHAHGYMVGFIFLWPALTGGVGFGLVALYFIAYNSVSSDSGSREEQERPSELGWWALMCALWPMSLSISGGYLLHKYCYMPVLWKLQEIRDWVPPPPEVAPTQPLTVTQQAANNLAAAELAAHWYAEDHAVNLAHLADLFAEDAPDVSDVDEEDDEQWIDEALGEPFIDEAAILAAFNRALSQTPSASVPKVTESEAEPESRPGPLLPGGPKEWDE